VAALWDLPKLMIFRISAGMPTGNGQKRIPEDPVEFRD
jgi:hypothetical protein